jgi:bifunctional DNA-binding transcriptional regulator/antitoxin component of YhaV-PrlF toxin-antitoxin module
MERNKAGKPPPRLRTSILSENGQTVIPVEVLRFLNVGPGDKLVYPIEDKRVFLEAANSSTRALYGCLKSGRNPPTKEEIAAARILRPNSGP